MAKAAAQAEDDELSPEELEEKRKQAELEDGRMPFVNHLVELRDRVRNAAIWFILAFLVCWYFAEQIFEWLREPLFAIWRLHTAPFIKPDEFDWGQPRLIFTGLTQPFWVDMSIGLWAGVFAASPFIFYQLWRFIAPGLYKKERRVAFTFAFFSGVFFICGALFCYYLTLPKLFEFLLSYNSNGLQSLPNIQDYLDLTRDSMLAFGAIFEMPLLIYFLAMVGLVTHRSLWKFSRWFIVLAFIIGAILTPGPDVVSQFLMATPMIVLYNISILLAWQVTAKREREARALEARNASAPKKKKKKIIVEVEDDDDDNTKGSAEPPKAEPPESPKN
jgi:sec-independent protein translocase protein TatC